MKLTPFVILLTMIFSGGVQLVSAQVKQLEPFKIHVDTSVASKLYLQSFAKRYVAGGNAASAFPKKVGTLELFNVYQLPGDNMPCLVPNNKNTGHVKVYGQTTAELPPGFYSDDIRFQKLYKRMDKYALIVP